MFCYILQPKIEWLILYQNHKHTTQTYTFQSIPKSTHLIGISMHLNYPKMTYSLIICIHVKFSYFEYSSLIHLKVLPYLWCVHFQIMGVAFLHHYTSISLLKNWSISVWHWAVIWLRINKNCERYVNLM